MDNTTINNKEKNLAQKTFSNLTSLLAVLSAAVGLGNIWKFPTLVGKNGGACFLIIFIIFSFLTTLPTFLIEYYLGHKTKQTALKAVDTLTNNNKKWRSIAYCGALASLFIVVFYSDVIGWVLKYFISTISGDLDNITDMATAGKYFSSVVGNPISVLFYQFIILVMASLIISFGVVDSINNIVKYFLLVLFGLLVFLLFISSNMSGEVQAIDFLFTADFSKINGSLLLSALGLALFKLSIGATCQWVYFSKFSDNINPIIAGVRCIFADLTISLLCGLVVFPIVFTFGLTPQAGPGLLFITLPLAFSQMKFGKILMMLFFMLTILAALGALISLMNVGVYFLKDKFNFSQRKAISVNFIVSFLLGSLASLSTTNILGGVKIFGKGFFDLFDFLSSNILLPLVSVLMVVLVCYKLDKEDVIQHIMKAGCSRKVATIWYYFTKYVCLLVIIIAGLGWLIM